MDERRVWKLSQRLHQIPALKEMRRYWLRPDGQLLARDILEMVDEVDRELRKETNRPPDNRP